MEPIRNRTWSRRPPAALIADMKQRELDLKSRLRATDAYLYSCAATGRAGGPRRRGRRDPRRPRPPRGRHHHAGRTGVAAPGGHGRGMAGLLGIPWRGPAAHEGGPAAAGQEGVPAPRQVLRGPPLGAPVAAVYYRGEDISAWNVPRILYFLEADPRFDTVDAALPSSGSSTATAPCTRLRRPSLRHFARRSPHTTNQLVISSSDETGRPSSRFRCGSSRPTGQASGTSRPRRRVPRSRSSTAARSPC